MSVFNPNYDWRGEAYALAPGVLPTRALDDALYAAYVANGYVKWTSGAVIAVTGPLPAFPTGLPRFVDSNPDPLDGWALDNQLAPVQ